MQTASVTVRRAAVGRRSSRHMLRWPIRRRRVKVRVPTTAFENKVTTADLTMRGCLVTTGTLRQWVFDNPLHHFPLVSAGRAFVLVGRHSKAFLKCSVAVPRTSRDRAPPNANIPKQSTAGTGFLSSLVIASSLSSPSSPRSITPHAAPRRAKRCVRSHRLSSPHNPHRPFFRLPPTFRIHLASRRLLPPIFYPPFPFLSAVSQTGSP